MKVIKPFALDLEPTQNIVVPFNAEVLDLVLAGDKPTLALLVDESLKLISRRFVIYSCGKEVAPALNATKYIGTFKYEGNNLYVFED